MVISLNVGLLQGGPCYLGHPQKLTFSRTDHLYVHTHTYIYICIYIYIFPLLYYVQRKLSYS